MLLQGNWLEQAGFSAGDKITVKCQQGRLVITKNEPESDTEAES
ncbi:SymE family type I addiction module toxin [Anaerotignum sp.]|nr:SymE family type I addiction module toxin [Anaerotignum sp.]MDY3597392.1 SymE family type I addiction module toxin [Anaerotignum sp.]